MQRIDVPPTSHAATDASPGTLPAAAQTVGSAEVPQCCSQCPAKILGLLQAVAAANAGRLTVTGLPMIAAAVADCSPHCVHISHDGSHKAPDIRKVWMAEQSPRCRSLLWLVPAAETLRVGGLQRNAACRQLER